MALFCSLALFGMGGILAHMIHGVNVTIPAHYHGSIVGISLAFMGLVYYIAPQLGFGRVEGRMAFWQPVVYAGGQFLHISGLAWSGGYGALRKTPGAVLSPEAKAGMALMGVGGLIAVIGGILFVLVALKAIRNRD
jgi:heme/copper-type cytochrome/quinol oxidase subunit 1